MENIHQPKIKHTFPSKQNTHIHTQRQKGHLQSVQKKLVFSLMVGAACTAGWANRAASRALLLAWLALMADSSRVLSSGAAPITVLKAAGQSGPMRMRFCRAKSCSPLEAGAAWAMVFSSSRQEIRVGTSRASSWTPGGGWGWREGRSVYSALVRSLKPWLSDVYILKSMFEIVY